MVIVVAIIKKIEGKRKEKSDIYRSLATFAKYDKRYLLRKSFKYDPWYLKLCNTPIDAIRKVKLSYELLASEIYVGYLSLKLGHWLYVMEVCPPITLGAVTWW